MKKIVAGMLLFLAASMSAPLYAGTPVSQSDLPKAAQTFLSKYFPKDGVKKAEKEQGRRGLEYDVDLASGAEVDFTEAGDWKEVQAAKGNAVPADIVPTAITKYVAANHSGQKIVEISRKRGGYELKLANGTELRLTEDAKPMQKREGGQRGGRR